MQYPSLFAWCNPLDDTLECVLRCDETFTLLPPVRHFSLSTDKLLIVGELMLINAMQLPEWQSTFHWFALHWILSVFHTACIHKAPYYGCNGSVLPHISWPRFYFYIFSHSHCWLVGLPIEFSGSVFVVRAVVVYFIPCFRLFLGFALPLTRLCPLETPSLVTAGATAEAVAKGSQTNLLLTVLISGVE